MNIDVWLAETDRLNRLADEIQAEINERARSNSLGNTAQTAIRKRLSVFQADLSGLTDELDKQASNPRSNMYTPNAAFLAALEDLLSTVRPRGRSLIFRLPGEVQRRRGLLTSLSNRLTALNQALTGQKSAPAAFVSSSGRAGGQPPRETDSTKNLDSAGLLDLQSQMMKDQDQHLEALGHVINRTKHMAVDIGTEIDEQTRLIGDLTDKTDRVEDKIRVETRRVVKFGEKEQTCTMWIVIIVLIIVVIFLGITKGGRSLMGK